MCARKLALEVTWNVFLGTLGGKMREPQSPMVCCLVIVALLLIQ